MSEGGDMFWTGFVVFLLPVCSVTQFLPCVIVDLILGVSHSIPSYPDFKSSCPFSSCLLSLLVAAVSHRSEYTPHIFVNILFYLFI